MDKYAQCIVACGIAFCLMCLGMGGCYHLGVTADAQAAAQQTQNK